MPMRQPIPCAFAFPVAPSSINVTDDDFMRRCVELALRAAGQTRPNPPVGCVITDQHGRVLGEGYHRCAGQPHAEVNALRNARARGHLIANDNKRTTAYVSLEPCNHHGRTPPCSKALIEAGVSRVVVGMQDPDPRTSGGGIKRLREAGIDVTVGIQQHLCQRVLDGFSSRILRKKPFGILKYAMTLDGKIATENGTSKWISGTQARQRVHSLRASVDAIIVGGETVRKDDPELTARGNHIVFDGPLRPMRVVMTRDIIGLPLERKLWDTSQAETIVFTQCNANDEHADRRQSLIDRLTDKGVSVVVQDIVTPRSVMDFLYEKECLNVLWECGGGLAAKAIKDGAVDKVFAFVAPKFVGGLHAPSPVGSPALRTDMADAIALRNREVDTFDNGDVLITGYL